MAYLLRSLLVLMVSGLVLVVLSAFGHLPERLALGHIELAIPSFMFLIFAQAFVMFYFIGVSRLVTNVAMVLSSGKNLNELFDTTPEDIGPYKKRVEQFLYQSTLSKRQTIPWTMLMLILGTLGFLLGGAHDTGLVEKIVHSGVIYGFLAAVVIGFFRQWYFLGKTHTLLRELKATFGLSSDQM